MEIKGIKCKTKSYKSYDGKIMDIFCESPELTKVVEMAKNEARIHIDETARDEGTCVLGAGIKMIYFPKGARKNYSELTLFSAPFQGNIGSYNALKPVLEYLQREFPELGCYWDDGRMD